MNIFKREFEKTRLDNKNIIKLSLFIRTYIQIYTRKSRIIVNKLKLFF